jgi:hypothetical protein
MFMEGAAAPATEQNDTKPQYDIRSPGWDLKLVPHVYEEAVITTAENSYSVPCKIPLFIPGDHFQKVARPETWKQSGLA